MTNLTPGPSGRNLSPLIHTADGYRCLGRLSIGAGPYRLQSLRRSDIQLIRVWRNAQLYVLRQRASVSEIEQEHYFDRVVQPGFPKRQPEMILMSLLREGKCIGYTGLTHIDWAAERAEISFLVDPARAQDPTVYQQDFSRCLEMLASVAFENLEFNRLFAETFDLRPAHIGILEAAGYRLEGRLREHVEVDGRVVDSLVHGLLRSDWTAEKN